MKNAAIVLLVVLSLFSAARASAECLIDANHPVAAKVALRICEMYPEIRQVRINASGARLVMPHRHHQLFLGAAFYSAEGYTLSR